MLYVPLGIGCNGYYSVGINAAGPVVNGVTLVLVVVAAMLLNVSFVNAFNAVTTVLFEATVTDGSFTDWIVYHNCSCSGITICWAYIQSC
jgi:hypothetical protein